MYLGGLEYGIHNEVEELVFPHPEVLGVDEEEQVGDAQQREQDQGGPHRLPDL